MSARSASTSGGTKMAVGVVDAEPNVLYRVDRAERRARRSGRAPRHARARAARGARGPPRRRAIGLGIPCTIDRERGRRDRRGQPADRRRPDPRPDRRAPRAARLHRQRRQRRGARRAPLRRRRAAPRNVVLLTIGTGIGGGLILDGKPYRGSIGAGAELGHMVIDEDGPPLPGATAPTAAASRRSPPGTALGARGRRRPPSASPDSALGRRCGRRAEIDGEDGHRRRRWPATRPRSRWSRRSAATWASASRATPTSSTPT